MFVFKNFISSFAFPMPKFINCSVFHNLKADGVVFKNRVSVLQFFMHLYYNIFIVSPTLKSCENAPNINP